MLSARDFVRSTQQLLRELEDFAAMLAIALPKLFAVANRVDRTHDGAAINKALREVFSDQASVQFLNVAIPSLVAYREATTRQIPVHIHETHRRGNSPAAREVMVELLGEIIDLQGLTLNLDLAAGFGSDAPAQEAARGR
jgi:chromosome partitioning related protein ParA